MLNGETGGRGEAKYGAILIANASGANQGGMSLPRIELIRAQSPNEQTNILYMTKGERSGVSSSRRSKAAPCSIFRFDSRVVRKRRSKTVTGARRALRLEKQARHRRPLALLPAARVASERSGRKMPKMMWRKV